MNYAAETIGNTRFAEKFSCPSTNLYKSGATSSPNEHGGAERRHQPRASASVSACTLQPLTVTKDASADRM